MLFTSKHEKESSSYTKSEGKLHSSFPFIEPILKVILTKLTTKNENRFSFSPRSFVNCNTFHEMTVTISPITKPD